MIALVQRVTHAEVSVAGREVGRCGHGFMVLFCAEREDSDCMVAKLAEKTAKLRVFEDDAGKMNRSLLDVKGEVLAISQFTLAADTKSGNRPSFTGAAEPEKGKRMYAAYVEALRALGVHTETGEFGAHMQVSLVNDGPVTVTLKLGS